MLLRFRVANHRSIRNEAELSMVSPSLRTVTPPGGDWVAATTRVAAIYGANAAGKSNVLSAIDFLVEAVSQSATTWADRFDFPYSPFLLDDVSASAPSSYEISLEVEGARYDYGFTSDGAGVHSEWLYAYPQGRRRTIFVRDGLRRDTVRLSRGSADDNNALLRLVTPCVLVLSAAARVEHHGLLPVHDKIRRFSRFAKFSDSDRSARMRAIREVLTESDTVREAAALLSMADVGITGVDVREVMLGEDVPTLPEPQPEPRTRATHFMQIANRMLVDDSDKQLYFSHLAQHEQPVEIPEKDQSSGTLAWLCLAVPALAACDEGLTLLVDELDASLHPRLAAALIEIFKDPELNHSGAQLVFTTHDVAFMNPSFSSVVPEEVWFVEKRRGATTLYSLIEFSTRVGENFAKRYLDGRYGAVPMIDLEELREIRRASGNEPPAARQA